MKRILSILVVIIMVASLAACGGGSQQTETQAQTQQAQSAEQTQAGTQAQAPKGNTVINVAALFQDYADAINICKDQYLSDLGVTLNFNVHDSGDLLSYYLPEFASHSSSNDIILFMPYLMADLGQYLEPLEPLAQKNGVDFKLDDIMPIYNDVYDVYDGQVVAVPFDGDQFDFFYNTDAFNSAKNQADFKTKFGYDLKPPETWTQYADMAEFFNGRDWDGSGKAKYGAAEVWTLNKVYYWFMAKYAGYGGVYFDENMNPLLNTPGAKEAMKIQLRVAKCVPPGSASFDYSDAATAFANGDVAMSYNWSSAGKNAMDPKNSKIVGKVGVTQIPGAMINGKLNRRCVLPTGWTLAIPKYSSNKDLAVKVLGILSQPENCLKISLQSMAGVDPWRQSQFDEQKWDANWPGFPGFGKSYISTQKATLESAMTDCGIKGADEYIKALADEIMLAIAGKESGDQALDNATKKWNEITNRYGKDEQMKLWNAQYNALKKMGIQYIPYQN